MSEGAWIFLSHSHKDFDRVKELRNKLEEQGHHPLLFFLKCLDDDSEIDGLIRREIGARSWFILCDSAHSRVSHWVAQKRQLIAALPTHSSAIVDLDASLADQLSSLSELTKRASVFLSYTRGDTVIAERIRQSLRADDFGAFSDLQVTVGARWQDEIRSALNSAVNRGAVLVLVSRASIASEWQRHEIALALERAELRDTPRNVVPIFLDPPWLTREFVAPHVRDTLVRIQGFDFSAGDFDENMIQVKRWLRDFVWQA